MPGGLACAPPTLDSGGGAGCGLEPRVPASGPKAVVNTRTQWTRGGEGRDRPVGVRELKVVQKHKQACGRERGPLWRSGGPSSLTPACAPQSPARRPCLSSLTPACTPQSPARWSCLCLQGWVVWGADPDAEAGPCKSRPQSAFGSSGSPGLSLGPGHPVCAQGLPPDLSVWVGGVSSS